MTVRIDPDYEQRRAADPKASVWVGASAGTGKTKVLTDRVLNLLLAGCAPHKILCLTFTKAAAAEMSNRIAEDLAKWSVVSDAELTEALNRLTGQDPEPEMMDHARRLFAHVLDAPGGMKIETIHAFCQSLLRRFPLEAGIAPHFEVMDERDAGELMIEARDEVLSGADKAVAEALSVVTAKVHEVNFPDLMMDLVRERGRLRRMMEHRGGAEAVGEAVRKRLGVGPDDTPDSVLARACRFVDEHTMKAAVSVLATGTKTDIARAEAIGGWLALDDRLAGFDDYCLAFLTKAGSPRKTLLTAKPAKANPGVAADLAEEAERLEQVAEHIKAVTIAHCTHALMVLAEALLAAYQRGKEARAVMDYDDLILATRALLETTGAAPWVLYKLDGGIDHVLVDEAQDTNPDQWAVFKALTTEYFSGRGTHEPGDRTVFAVGDRKQSIYSFQGADPKGFNDTKAWLTEMIPASEAEFREVDLHISFRSTRAVLDAVDEVFKRDPGRDGVAMEGEDISHISFRDQAAGLVEVWPPVEPEERDETPPWKLPVERTGGSKPSTRLAHQMAVRIAQMIDNKEMLLSKDRPIQPDDIMVLVRRRGGFVEDLVRALKQRDVETAGVDRMTLTEQMPVMDLLALGNFLLLPQDDLTLASVLKCPLVGLTEDELFTLAHGRSGTLWEALSKQAGGASRFGVAHRYLEDLLARADYTPPHELYAHVLGRLGGRKRLLERLGPEAEDPIDEFMTLTLTYERGHAPSLQGFLNWLEAGEIVVKRDLEQVTRNAVRIMTVHGSKGLQAPIVFLPDTLQKPVKVPNLLWQGEGDKALLLWSPKTDTADPVCRELKDEAKLDRDREYRRLLYVAMTRAEDRLYVCGWNTRNKAPEDCWYNLVAEALAPIAAQDGDVLRLSCDQLAPIEKYDTQAKADEVLPLYDWAKSPPPAEPSPPRPLAPSGPVAQEPAVTSPLGRDDGSRFRRGKLIHRLLQSLPDVPPDNRAVVAEIYLGHAASDLEEDQRRALAVEALSVLEHPDFADLFGPGSRAEVPVIGLLGAYAVSGQVDRLVVTETRVRVVDFKTNRPPPTDSEMVDPAYLHQMATYRAVLQQIYPDREVECVLLWTDEARLMALCNKKLDKIAADII